MITSGFYNGVYPAAVAGAAIAVALSAPAAAQNTAQAQDSDSAMTEIVVTARRVEERLQDVPLAVSAYDAEILDTRVIVTHQDLNKLDPALFVQTSPPRGTFYPYMRGQAAGAGGAGNASVPSGVIPYFADAPNIYPAFFDLANIQVVKGPQGTLFGETATGGVILFQPKRPDGEFEGYVEGQIGNHGHADAELALTVPIVGDRFSVRVAGQIRQRDGFTKIINSRPGVPSSFADDVDQESFRISSVIRPTDDLEIYTVYMKDVQHSNGTSGILHAIYDATAFLRTVPNPSPATPASAVTATRFLYYTGYEAPVNRSYLSLLQDRLALQRQLGPRAYTVNYDTRSKREYWALINQIGWNITDNVTFKNITSWSQTSTRGSSIQLDGSDLPVIDSAGQICRAGISPEDCMDQGPKPFSNEARFNGTLFDDRLNWQTGFYYREVPEVVSGPGGAVIIAASPSGIPVSPAAAVNCVNGYGVSDPCTQLTKTLSESYAGYGQVTYEVVDGVHVTGGFRRTWDYLKSTTVAGPHYTTTFNGQTIGQSVLGTDPLPNSREIVTEVPRDHTDTYTLGADWKVTDDILLYANHRKGHKIGGVNAIIPQGNPLRFFEPESVKDIELGMKASFELGSIRIDSDLALFRTDFSDIQKRTSTQVEGVLLTYVDNVAAARINGIELGLNIDPSPYFNLSVQYAYLDAQFTNWVDTVTCASDLTATGCRGLPTTALVVTDHVAGTKTANGVTDRFRTDLFTSAPEHRLVVAPTVKLGFLSGRLEDASLSANITYTTSMASGDINYSLLIPEKDLLVPSRTGVDLRFDWRNFMEIGGVTFDSFLSVTNLFDETDVVGRNTFINLCGCVNDQYTDPRVVFGGIKAKF